MYSIRCDFPSLPSSLIAFYKLVNRSCGMPIIILQTMAIIMHEVGSYMLPSRHLTLIHLFLTAIACEVLARQIVHNIPEDRLTSVMSTRYRNLDADGDSSDFTSALELAIDTHWYELFNMRITEV